MDSDLVIAGSVQIYRCHCHSCAWCIYGVAYCPLRKCEQPAQHSTGGNWGARVEHGPISTALWTMDIIGLIQISIRRTRARGSGDGACRNRLVVSTPTAVGSRNDPFTRERSHPVGTHGGTREGNGG